MIHKLNELLSKSLSEDEVLHIAYGKVAYPINFKELNIDSINIPVGVKFEIGELLVTPSRESIEYTPAVKTLILERRGIIEKGGISMLRYTNTLTYV